MRVLRKSMVLIVIGVVLVLGGYAFGRMTQRNAVVLAANTAQSNAAKVSNLQTQKTKLQMQANNLNSQLSQSKAANALLQEELVDRPTIIAPGTVKDLDGDEK